jgi:hypothetical protein
VSDGGEWVSADWLHGWVFLPDDEMTEDKPPTTLHVCAGDGCKICASFNEVATREDL